jgi:hypothetical protein
MVKRNKKGNNDNNLGTERVMCSFRSWPQDLSPKSGSHFTKISVILKSLSKPLPE